MKLEGNKDKTKRRREEDIYIYIKPAAALDKRLLSLSLSLSSSSRSLAFPTFAVTPKLQSCHPYVHILREASSNTQLKGNKNIGGLHIYFQQQQKQESVVKRDHFVFFHRAKKNTFGIFDYVAFFGWMVNADGLAHTFLGKVLSKFAYFWTIEDWKKNSRPHSVTQHSTLLARLLGRCVRIPPACRDSMPKWRETASQNLNKEAPPCHHLPALPLILPVYLSPCCVKRNRRRRENIRLCWNDIANVFLLFFFFWGSFRENLTCCERTISSQVPYTAPHTLSLSFSLSIYVLKKQQTSDPVYR